MVDMDTVSERHDAEELRALIEGHVRETGSPLGRRILGDFEQYLPKFKKIIPRDYKRMIAAIGQMEEKGMSHEKATLEAFYAVRKG